MAKLKDKIQNVLDEGRMLVLGSQVLLGFQFRSMMEKGFESLPRTSQYLKLGGLGLMLVAIALLILPSAYHRVVEEGEDTNEFHRFASRVMVFALLPFAFGLGIDLYVGTTKVAGNGVGAAAGIIGCAMALILWYGLEIVRRGAREPEIREKREMEKKKESEDSGSSERKITDKIRHVLTEARVVLPGAQALLGFQFISLLTESFDKLPETSKYIHLASLALIALAVIFLMTPASYHRIVEEGEETEHFHRFASRMVLAAMIPLALGICGDVYVVVRKVIDNEVVAVVTAAAMLALFYGLWFGFTLYRRSVRSQEGAGARISSAHAD